MTLDIIFDGQPITVEGDYEPYEADIYYGPGACPGHPENLSLERVYIKAGREKKADEHGRFLRIEIDILDWLSDETKEQIEEEALRVMKDRF